MISPQSEKTAEDREIKRIRAKFDAAVELHEISSQWAQDLRILFQAITTERTRTREECAKIAEKDIRPASGSTVIARNLKQFRDEVALRIAKAIRGQK